jgi:hypothetical protein
MDGWMGRWPILAPTLAAKCVTGGAGGGQRVTHLAMVIGVGCHSRAGGPLLEGPGFSA